MKIRIILGLAPLALTVPSLAAAQPHQHTSGMQMPGMTMPAAKPAKPQAKPMPKPALRPTMRRSRARPAVPVAGATPSPRSEDGHEHDAGMAGMDMSDSADTHAGHGMAAKPDMSAPKSGTDLPPGTAAPPLVQPGRPADNYHDPAAMARAESALLGSHGGMVFHRLLIDLAEYQVRDGRDGYRWDGEFWIGGDTNRLVLKSEGEGSVRDRVERAEVQALYAHALDPYWNLQIGIRQDLEPKPTRTYAVLGVEGLAPYWIGIDAALFLSDKGDVLGRVAASYDQRITRRLILQPRGELNFSLQDMPRQRSGSGVSDLELGLRLRYEIKREFAPYVGISWERRLGETADFARLAGEDSGGASFVVGVRAWF